MNAWTRLDCLASLQRFARETGSVSSKRYTREHRRPSQDTIRKVFGSWPAAVRAAGLVPWYREEE